MTSYAKSGLMSIHTLLDLLVEEESFTFRNKGVSFVSFPKDRAARILHRLLSNAPIPPLPLEDEINRVVHRTYCKAALIRKIRELTMAMSPTYVSKCKDLIVLEMLPIPPQEVSNDDRSIKERQLAHQSL
jgi:hypothetical protein